ncbi:hypothetical protein AM593_10587, partial [Mytilus galloprovincialis]
MFTEKIMNKNEASRQNIETSSFVQEIPSFSAEDSKTSHDHDIPQDKVTHGNRMIVGSQDDTDEIEIIENKYNVKTKNTQEESADVEIKESNPNQETVKTNQTEKFQDNQIKRNEVENETGQENDKNLVQMVSSVMESCLHLNSDELHDKLALCTLWDFAGQIDFYATHQVFLSKCAVFLLVTDSLESSYADQLWIDFKDTAQYVRFWFDAIHCYWSTSTTKKNRLDPPIIVVCTNEDKIKNKKQHKSEFNMNLGKILNPQKKNEHLRNIYFVSNTEDDDTVFQEIRQEISNHAMTMNDWGRKCPLKWLLFQQVLVKMKDSDVPISTTTKLEIIAKHDSIGIDNDKEFKKCLEYFHDIGSVIYFDEENLKEHVILDPKWLIDAFRCLVTDKVENIIQSSLDWRTLKENVFEFLPPAFFNHILAWYIKQYDVSTFFDKRTGTKRNALYRQIGVFDLDSNACEQLVVCEGPNIVALQVWNYTEYRDKCGEIANELFEFINSIEKRYSLRVTYTKSFTCTDGNFTMNQKTVNDLLHKPEYWCSEHNTIHDCDDILEPWEEIEEIK